MQTGEYRGFVGQFSVWLHVQLAIWRAPLLLSLAIHILFFWPQPLQEKGLAASVIPASAPVEARLVPVTPVLPLAPVRLEPQVHRAAVTQSSYGALPRGVGRQHDALVSAAAREPEMQPTMGLDAGAVRAYRIAWARALMGSALREQLSAERQGALEVGVALTASGQVRDIAVLKSSGDTALDRAVIAAMRSAVPVVQAPPAMLGQALVLTVPVEVGAVPPTSAAGR